MQYHIYMHCVIDTGVFHTEAFIWYNLVVHNTVSSVRQHKLAILQLVPPVIWGAMTKTVRCLLSNLKKYHIYSFQ